MLKIKSIILGAIVVGLSLSMSGLMGGCSSQKFDETKEISLYTREPGSGTRGAFIELFGIEVKGENGEKTDRTAISANTETRTDVMLTDVSQDNYAIGYVSLGSLSDEPEVYAVVAVSNGSSNDGIKALKIDGVSATNENVKNGSYKIARPFNIATKKGANLSEVAQDFINWIMSKEGQEVVAKNYTAVEERTYAPPANDNLPSGKVVIVGSSSVAPLMEKLAEAYEDINENANIEIQSIDSTTGMNYAMEGTCDIGMASRDLKESEAEKLDVTSIAIDGIAVIVNKNNSFDSASSEQIRDIFIGEIKTWDGLK